MKKFHKAISSTLVVLLLGVILVQTNTIKVNAQTIQQNQKTGKITNSAEAIQLIQKRFLIQNSDGTTKISTEASKYIDSGLLAKIEKGANQINKGIQSNNLIFDKSTKTIYERQHATPSTYIAGTYIWHWYGYDFVMDAYNSNIFGSQLAQTAALLSGGAVVGALIPGASVVCGAGAATLAYWSSVAWEGNANGRGSIAYFWGDPSWSQLYSVQGR
ncbi:hypothetical protein [Clostridium sp.]|jgi:hypothetical protein|uniref:hypothetical protein n=1 Tax=Clostridium sp. TaxID=1506 RepID=UPI00258B1C47|nr:hypothetical protein [Clostridium sp.]MDF2505175.1 hypothetical protein [Clostridium sp.]